MAYHARMKSKPKSPEFQRFEDALRHIISVPKEVVLAEIERTHKTRKRKPTASASGRVPDGDAKRRQP